MRLPRRRAILRCSAAIGLVWLASLMLTAYFRAYAPHAAPPIAAAPPEPEERANAPEVVVEKPRPVVADKPRPKVTPKPQKEPQQLVREENGHEGEGNIARPPEPPKPRPTNNPNAPGELGKAVHIDLNKLSPEERAKYDRGWRENAFNEYVSKMIALNRSLSDGRDEECRREVYPRDLPDTSVIICFHNEAWSVLLRTIHSVLDRSPAHLIKEIILVDDFSDRAHLKQPLEDYVRPLGKVRVVRAKRREGLIRARLLGASVADGQVLTYLDSHCECVDGWLEPLLARIRANESNVVCPVIDVIDDTTFRFNIATARYTSLGGFDWNLQFSWHAIPDSVRATRKRDIDPLPSPTMAGGLFSISKKYFEKLGSYDPGMDIWGGENLELSFRVWMCGGRLEIVPCSHVGHIFRKRSPYSWGITGNVVRKNSVRLAEVWMDDYKKYYYQRFNYDLGNYGDVSARKSLRARLKCRSFEWYINVVYPHLFIPSQCLRLGEIRNKAFPMCVDAPSTGQHNVKLWPCHRQGGNQFWMLSDTGEIRRDDQCLDYTGDKKVSTYGCHGMKGNQHWEITMRGQVRHAVHHFCMESSPDGKALLMASCGATDRQIWLWPVNKDRHTRPPGAGKL